MEFHEKIQEMRKKKGLTQEELAASLYVSRTAISKWESGRGYPNIDSLKALAKFFSVTVDDLLSTDEALTIAEEEGKRKENLTRDLLYGFLDLSMAMLFFLPFFAESVGDALRSVSLIALCGVQPYLKAVYFTVVIATAFMGILTLALQSCRVTAWMKIKAPLSLGLGATMVLLFVISSQPYAAVFAFVLLTIKALMLIRWR